jgi:FYVE zinc finger
LEHHTRYERLACDSCTETALKHSVARLNPTPICHTIEANLYLRMSSSKSSASSSNSVEELASPPPGRRSRVSTQGSITQHPNDPQQDQESSQNSADHMRPPEGVNSEASLSSRVRNPDKQAWPDFLRDHATQLMDEGEVYNRRASQLNRERKRRLTNSAHNSGRVRTVSGGFHSRNPSSHASHLGGGSSAGLPQIQRFDPSIPGPQRPNVSESTMETFPPRRPHSSNMQGPVSTTREVILPKWQPDSEASECPMCSRQFTFWFRKHHCRKCGRVVCAGCSPHRITIPRQFIVHPPESTNRSSTIDTSTPVVIDLTGETGSSTRSDMPSSWTSPRRTSNPGLGGGEEVRLCNPCVPDPQPSPQAIMDLAEFLRQGPARDDVGRPLERPQPSPLLHLEPGQPRLYSQPSPSDEARELRRQRGRGMIVCADRQLMT